MLKEEVLVEEHPNVTPIAVQRPNEKSTGAGEEIPDTAAAAIANAILRRHRRAAAAVPLTPARVTASLRVPQLR
jgi:hypothetical protein